MIDPVDLSRILDSLEEQECKLLTWGDTGGTFSEEEILAIIEGLTPGLDVDEVLDALEQKAMIYAINGPTGRPLGFRTRMGHAVHLYRNLRQWMHGQSLNASRTLVSDFRFLRRPRRYPVRDKDLAELTGRQQSNTQFTSIVEDAMQLQVGAFQLSGFQSRATERLLEAHARHKRRVTESSATIICAGTGSGKTLSFYLPALASLAQSLAEDSSSRVRILAIYPRNELLKDQFNEAWRACRKLDALTNSTSGRKIRIGAFYGNTPNNAQKAQEKSIYTDAGLMRCASPTCDGDMRWQLEDVKQSLERLTCKLCGSQVTNDEVMLTRSAMEKSPPDIIFTTTEMLNQQIGNPSRNKLFGVNISAPIPLVLLDEVHTYNGNQGAQVAFLLRRWVKLSRTAPHFVGLSATLADAENFFSRLTGTKPSQVRMIEPLEHEMREEGAEYLVVLRGDPVSQTALLSTSIQASMLTRRILDSNRLKPSQGIWGSKTFVFTDDLDVNNRLYSQLADAEGWWQISRNLSPNNNGPLAQLRNPNRVDSPSKTEMNMFGQDWSALQRNGFSLDRDDRAIVSRTSSQDSGVQSDSDMVIATASLEVGFNDEAVGAIMQHKAPRAVSSYLQRKGRAGRTRAMRPWMIVVLSDFGRDRDVYQHYEKLLEPEVKLQGLPITNVHVQRMQASMATLNWLENKLGGIHLWTKLNFPEYRGELDPKLFAMLELIDEALQPGISQIELTDYIQQSLRLDDNQIVAVMWQPPRSIMMEFLPNLRRKIATRWGKWDSSKQELVKWVESNDSWGSPVPEFIPDQLFSDLNLPTLDVKLDRGPLGLQSEGMGFFQGLREFAPGRISKRFSTHSGQASDWVIPCGFFPAEELDNSESLIEVGEVFGDDTFHVGDFDLPSGQKIKVIKPYQVNTQSLFNSSVISDTSNAFLNWHTQFRVMNQPEIHPTIKTSLWTDYLKSMSFYTHRSMTPVDIIRFNTGSNAEFRFKATGNRAKIKFSWQEYTNPVAIGACQSVDGVELKYSLSKGDLKEWLNDESLMSKLRIGYFQDLLRESAIADKNRFTADWLFDCFLATVMADVSEKNINLAQAIDNVDLGRGTLNLIDAPFLLFQKNLNDSNVESGEPNEESTEAIANDQRLQKDLVDRLERKEVVTEISRIAKCLYEDLSSDSSFIDWCFTIVGNTLAAALKQSILSLLPDVDDRSLIIDPDFHSSNIIQSIWMSEEDSGGTGIVAQFQDIYTEDPLQVLNVLAKQLENSEYEQLDADLICLLLGLSKDESSKKAFFDLRNATSFGERIVANRSLRKVLSSEGFQISHSFSAVLHSRVLRSGSSIATDEKLANYLASWGEIESTVGLELPLNIIAFVIAYQSHDSALAKEKIFGETCAVQSVLWPRGAQLRQSALQFYNPFAGNTNNRTERCLASKLCVDNTQVVAFAEESWLLTIHEILGLKGKVDLFIAKKDVGELNKIIAILHATPIDTYGLLVYPRIENLRHSQQSIAMRIELAESVF